MVKNIPVARSPFVFFCVLLFFSSKRRGDQKILKGYSENALAPCLLLKLRGKKVATQNLRCFGEKLERGYSGTRLVVFTQLEKNCMSLFMEVLFFLCFVILLKRCSFL